MRRKLHSRSGFTVIELMVVLVLTGVVASITIASITNALDKSRVRATMADMRSITRAIEAYSVHADSIPAGEGGVETLVDVIVPESNKTLPVKDHWGHRYHFTNDADGNYTIASFGKDGIDGLDYDLVHRGDFNLDLVIYNGIFTAAPQQ